MNQQNDPTVRDLAVGILINSLTSDGRYADAAEWTVSSQSLRSDELPNILGNWQHANADEASAWLENAKLPDAEKGKIKQVMDSYK